MKNKKLILKLTLGIFLIFLFYSTLSFAISPSMYFRYMEDAIIKISCFNNNTFCSENAVCNITIFYPNNTVLVNNKNMINNLTYHYYILPANMTNVVGTYQAIVNCKDNNYYGKSIFNFEINQLGGEVKGNFLNFLFFAFILLSIFFFAAFFVSKSLPEKIISILLGVIVLFFAISLITLNTEIAFSQYIFSYFNSFYRASTIIFFAVILLIIVTVIFKILDYKKTIKQYEYEFD